jgi:cell wall-associated NlpC family hydrolase
MLLALLLVSLRAAADPGAASLVEAQRYLGTPYVWGGRATARNPGLDCLGLMFRGVAAATGARWTAFPVDPTAIVASGALGRPVPGLDGVRRAALPLTALRPGDALYLLLAGHRIPDAPLWVAEGQEYWPWHTALYADAGEVLHASPAAGVVRASIWSLPWDALYVTRLP